MFAVLPSFLTALILGQVAEAAPTAFRSADDVREYLRSVCDLADSRCIEKACTMRWTDPVSALSIINYLVKDDRDFVDPYLRHHYERERDGNVRIVLLSLLMERNRPGNLSFVIALLPESKRMGREGDRPSHLALRYLQRSVFLEYKCEDKRMAEDKQYRKWVKSLYLNWYEQRAPKGILYDRIQRRFVSDGDQSGDVEAHLGWASDCQTATYADER